MLLLFFCIFTVSVFALVVVVVCHLIALKSVAIFFSNLYICIYICISFASSLCSLSLLLSEPCAYCCPARMRNNQSKKKYTQKYINKSGLNIVVVVVSLSLTISNRKGLPHLFLSLSVDLISLLLSLFFIRQLFMQK